MASRLDGNSLLALNVLRDEEVDCNFARQLFAAAAARSEGHTAGTINCFFAPDTFNTIVVEQGNLGGERSRFCYQLNRALEGVRIREQQLHELVLLANKRNKSV